MRNTVILLGLIFNFFCSSCQTKKTNTLKFNFLEKKELNLKTKNELRILRNEIFARKGYAFKDSLLLNFFSNKSWYTPNENAQITLNKKEKSYISLIKEVEKEKSILKETKHSLEFLDYIDESLIFQELHNNNQVVYAFVCDGNDTSINFSGTLYLSPVGEELNKWQSQKYKEKSIDSINRFFTVNKIHKKYSIWAEITHKEYFLPLEDWVDNPCEFYKENRKVVIYHSAQGESNWKKKETTTNLNRILELVKTTQSF